MTGQGVALGVDMLDGTAPPVGYSPSHSRKTFTETLPREFLVDYSEVLPSTYLDSLARAEVSPMPLPPQGNVPGALPPRPASFQGAFVAKETTRFVPDGATAQALRSSRRSAGASVSKQSSKKEVRRRTAKWIVYGGFALFTIAFVVVAAYRFGAMVDLLRGLGEDLLELAK